MAPHSNYDEDEEIDFSDLQEQFDVRLDEGLDTFVVVDGCPCVPEDSKSKLIKFLCKKLSEAGPVKPDSVYMPIDEKTKQTSGFAFVEFDTPEQALKACKTLDGMALDKKHSISINKLTDIEHYGREGRVKEEFVEPHVEPYVEQEHLRSWLGEPNARDQMIMFRGDSVGVFQNRKKDAPEMMVDRAHWTESFVQWSPQGTYLTSIHAQGVQLWGGASWKRIRRFAHPFVNLVDYSPCENYLVTWSNKPITVPENPPPGYPLTADEDGKQFIIWDIKTGAVVRSFAAIESTDPAAEKTRKKISWPAFKWSADDKYVARLVPGQAIQIYQTPDMTLIGKKSVKIEGVVDFEWQPAIPSSGKGKPQSEQLLCYWTPEMNNQTARAGLMSIPSKEIVRTRNLVNVSDCKLHWQSEGKYLCVKVDRHTKTKKSNYTSLEFFRVTEKNIPVEIVELKQVVVNFAWEPQGNRFVFITTDEAVAGAAVAPKTNIHFYAPEKLKNGVGEWMCAKVVEKKNSNAIYWAPKGRFVILATVHSQISHELDFWDVDFEGEKQKQDKVPANKELACNIMLMNTAEHFGVTDVEWDPTGRYVATSASAWKHTMENGYHLYDFKGALLREEPIERFNQFLWRPRPPTLLSKEEQKNIRKNLKEYSRVFDEEDEFEALTANKEVVEARKRLLNEWLAWRERSIKDLEAERQEVGWTPVKLAGDDEDAVIEEIVEEVIAENEEVID
ncbi:Similar to Eukaryotic translation initiation factor 3 subunit B; acc. no. A7EHM8 [Pyronema omphalodes CBS 100304]|uniref:Eukaryotic translation initiation factor 3 subunit B n=1 Tax=Pyronema omphalodes (strain CBS 100304) TaxID=1076935 RepID=U4LUF1_PYROM|nr:Similar to Eukaryotic translation initiation factor 3 subunit B; acc. no. A7EHM8 [Pyronema omphalodes CBS 100304]